jgi:hypothetical protein
MPGSELQPKRHLMPFTVTLHPVPSIVLVEEEEAFPLRTRHRRTQAVVVVLRPHLEDQVGCRALAIPCMPIQDCRWKRG